MSKLLHAFVKELLQNKHELVYKLNSTLGKLKSKEVCVVASSRDRFFKSYDLKKITHLDLETSTLSQPDMRFSKQRVFCLLSFVTNY